MKDVEWIMDTGDFIRGRAEILEEGALKSMDQCH